MPWIADLERFTRRDERSSQGNLHLIDLEVVLTDQTSRKERIQLTIADNITPAGLKDRLRREVALIENHDTVEQAFAIGPLDLSPDPITPPNPPTKEQQDLAAFNTARFALQVAKQKVDLGLVAVDAAEYVALVDAAKAAYKPEYIGL